MNNLLLGGVEAGGTKMVCAVGYSPDKVLDEVRFPTTRPEETLQRVNDYFLSVQEKYGELGAIGYGTFGPAVVTPGESGYGTILSTPKPGWQGVDVLASLQSSFPNVMLAFDTDVNAAALGEGFAGAARGLKNYIYVTVGTGIGGGVVIDGRSLKARPHAEIGHMLVPVLPSWSGHDGCCPFHGNCLEGLASGPALAARWGVRAEELPMGHEAWDHEAEYLGMMVLNLVSCYAPERIILGGGVMEQHFLLDKVREGFCRLAGGYWPHDGSIIVSPALGNQAGITGALLMARDALSSKNG